MTYRLMKGLALLAALAAVVSAPLAAQAAQAAPAAPAAQAPEAAKPAQDGMTADELIAKNMEAKGGQDKLAAIKTAKVTGKVNMGGAEAPFTLMWEAPNKIRMEITLQGMTLTRAFDGETAWMINPFMGKTDPEKMSPEEADQVKEEADFRGPLFEPHKKGYKVAFGGETEIEGTPAYELDVTRPDGGTSKIYLDKEYFLEFKQDDKRTLRGQEMETSTAVGDYKEVDGLMFAHSFDTHAVGAPEGQGGFNMTIENIELNPTVPEGTFSMPAAKPADAKDQKPEQGKGSGVR